MNRLEQMQDADKKEMADILCGMFDEVSTCDFCPMNDKCSEEGNGFEKWLEEDI